MSTQFSRQELYGLVWSEAMSALSKKFDISDVGLAKACKRANIPIPPRGYWNKVYAGKITIKVPLPARFLGQSEYVRIGGNYWERPDIDLEKGPPSFDETLDAVVARAKSILVKVTIPKSLSNPHPLIAKLLAADEQRIANNSPYSWEGPIFYSPLEKRRLRILNGIFSAMQQAGCSAEMRGKKAEEIWCVVGDQRLSLTLEPLNQKQRAAWLRGSLTENISNELKLVVQRYKGVTDDIISEWCDSPDGTLEVQLHDIVSNMMILGEIHYRLQQVFSYECQLERKREADLKAQRQREELERKRQEEIRLALEKKRAKLVDQATCWQSARDIRAFVAAMVNHPDISRLEAKEVFEQWQGWALKEADIIDPLCAPIDKIIGDQR